MTNFFLEEGKSNNDFTNNSLARPRSSRPNSSHQNRLGDLVIDDDIEGELTLGEGKAGLLGKPVTPMYAPGLRAPAKTRRRTDPAHVIRSDTQHSNPQNWKYGRPLQADVETRTEESPSPAHSSVNNTSASSRNKMLDEILQEPSQRISLEEILQNPSQQISQEEIRLKPSEQVSPDISEGEFKQRKVKTTGKSSYDDFVKLRREERRKLQQDASVTELRESDSVRYDVNVSSIQSSGGIRSRRSPQASSGGASDDHTRGSSSTEQGDESLRDLDSTDIEETTHVRLTAPPMSKLSQKTHEIRPIDIQTAMELKQLIFGSVSRDISSEWKYQGFTFSDKKRLQYGLVQKHGGPCGVLASVQALLLRELLFTHGPKASTSHLQPSAVRRSDCLCKALAHILWRAGSQKTATLTTCTGRPQFTLNSKFKGDNFTETLLLHTFDSYEELLLFLQQNNAQFELDGNHGVLHSLYSLVLSRSVNGVKSDMDETTNKLIGAHNYCSQDLVNLYLTGRACSNVFNDVVELDSGGSQTTVLRGLTQRSQIGFLSLFEHYKSCQVGTYYKTPLCPIWVVCSESHFTVLFSLNKALVNNWRAERRFDLYYYDGLANQDDQIKLTLDTTNQYYTPPRDDDLVPPIDLCIRTKWEGAEIDWNGTEPLL